MQVMLDKKEKEKERRIMELLVVTGLSGAGKSLAVNALEDIGYFCIDNIPAGLMPRLLDFALQGETMLEKVAVVVDIRGCLLYTSCFRCRIYAGAVSSAAAVQNRSRRSSHTTATVP